MKQQLQATGQKRGFRWWSRYVVLAGGALILLLGVLVWVAGGAQSSDLVKRYPAPSQSADVIQGLPIAESETEPAAEAPSEAAAEAEAETETEPQGEAESEPEAPSEAAAEVEAETESQDEAESDADAISFAIDVMPIFEARCVDCHGTDGSWDASSYESVMTTGDHAPVVIPGDVEGSLLAQKLVGTHEEGRRMPPWPLRKLSDDLIQVVFDWIAAGAPE